MISASSASSASMSASNVAHSECLHSIPLMGWMESLHTVGGVGIVKSGGTELEETIPMVSQDQCVRVFARHGSINGL